MGGSAGLQTVVCSVLAHLQASHLQASLPESCANSRPTVPAHTHTHTWRLVKAFNGNIACMPARRGTSPRDHWVPRANVIVAAVQAQRSGRAREGADCHSTGTRAGGIPRARDAAIRVAHPPAGGPRNEIIHGCAHLQASSGRVHSLLVTATGSAASSMAQFASV